MALSGAPRTLSKATQAASLLREAGAKIETALLLLDTRSQPCGNCGVTHYENLPQARIYEKLTDTPAKLKGCADSLERTHT